MSPSDTPTPFVLPAGISLAIGGNSLVIRHAGDIVLEQTLGRRLSRVEASGDLTLRLSPITGVLRAGGTLRAEGDIDAQELRGDVIEITDVKVRARVIAATTRVVIGSATVSADVIVAPEVVISPDATGRVRIIDCLNDRPATKIRGCLSLEDYESDFGGAAEFLARRGVTPVTNLPTPGGPNDADDAFSDDPFTQDEPAAESVDHDEPEASHTDLTHATELVEDVAPAPPPPPAPEPAREPMPVIRRTSTRRPGPGKVRKAVARLEAAYDSPPPPAAQALSLVSDKAFDDLADRIDTLWSDLIRHHIAIGTNPPRDAVLGFHQLHSMLD